VCTLSVAHAIGNTGGSCYGEARRRSGSVHCAGSTARSVLCGLYMLCWLCIQTSGGDSVAGQSLAPTQWSGAQVCQSKRVSAGGMWLLRHHSCVGCSACCTGAVWEPAHWAPLPCCSGRCMPGRAPPGMNGWRIQALGARRCRLPQNPVYVARCVMVCLYHGDSSQVADGCSWSNGPPGVLMRRIRTSPGNQMLLVLKLVNPTFGRRYAGCAQHIAGRYHLTGDCEQQSLLQAHLSCA